MSTCRARRVSWAPVQQGDARGSLQGQGDRRRARDVGRGALRTSMAPKVAAMDTWRPHATVRIDRHCRAWPADRSLVAEDRSDRGVRDHTGPGNPTGTELGPRLVHTPSESSGSQRSPVVSSGRSFAQVAGAILRKQAQGQNPDKDEAAGSSPARPTNRPVTSGNAGRFASRCLPIRGIPFGMRP